MFADHFEAVGNAAANVVDALGDGDLDRAERAEEEMIRYRAIADGDLHIVLTNCDLVYGETTGSA